MEVVFFYEFIHCTLTKQNQTQSSSHFVSADNDKLLTQKTVWHVTQKGLLCLAPIFKGTTVSDKNIGQGLPIPSFPQPNVVSQVRKKYLKKIRHHCSNIETGEEEFLTRVFRESFGWNIDCSYNYQKQMLLLLSCLLMFVYAC